MFGRQFPLTPSPNRFGIPAFYALHAWAWKVNPEGDFFAWNPRVDCSRLPASGFPQAVEQGLREAAPRLCEGVT